MQDIKHASSRGWFTGLCNTRVCGRTLITVLSPVTCYPHAVRRRSPDTAVNSSAGGIKDCARFCWYMNIVKYMVFLLARWMFFERRVQCAKRWMGIISVNYIGAVYYSRMQWKRWRDACKIMYPKWRHTNVPLEILSWVIFHLGNLQHAKIFVSFDNYFSVDLKLLRSSNWYNKYYNTLILLGLEENKNYEFTLTSYYFLSFSITGW